MRRIWVLWSRESEQYIRADSSGDNLNYTNSISQALQFGDRAAAEVWAIVYSLDAKPVELKMPRRNKP